MARMTRTQVTLHEDEYHFLKAQAARDSVSLSSLVRDLVRERMEHAAASAPHVWDVAGIITTSDFTGRDHDAVLSEDPHSHTTDEPRVSTPWRPRTQSR